jgi:hypothetical protein
MQRIAIIGNAGGGKSVMARKLGFLINIPVYEFDNLQWKPGWKTAPAEEIARVHKTWVNQSSWVIEGWGNWDIIEERFNIADTLIFIDYPLWVHYWWVTKRQVKAIFKRNPSWPPKGCLAFPVTGRLFKLIWTIHKDMRPNLIKIIKQYSDKKQVFHLHSPRETERFLKRLEIKHLIVHSSSSSFSRRKL